MTVQTRTQRRARRAPAVAPRGGDNALVLATVTAVLKHRLENGLVAGEVTAHLGGDTTISVLPPDRITVGAEEKPQLNLFLYQIKPRGLDSHRRLTPEAGAEHASGASLVYELHYLLSAYGAQDLHTEILLGSAMELLHSTPVLSGDMIRATLASLASTEGGRVVLPALVAVAASELPARLEQIRVSSQHLEADEIFNLWSTLQATYRPSAVYKVLVFMVEDAVLPPGRAT